MVLPIICKAWLLYISGCKDCSCFYMYSWTDCCLLHHMNLVDWLTPTEEELALKTPVCFSLVFSSWERFADLSIACMIQSPNRGGYILTPTVPNGGKICAWTSTATTPRWNSNCASRANVNFFRWPLQVEVAKEIFAPAQRDFLLKSRSLIVWLVKMSVKHLVKRDISLFVTFRGDESKTQDSINVSVEQE